MGTIQPGDVYFFPGTNTAFLTHEYALEKLGLEVWPAPFLTDIAGFGLRREMDWRMDEGRYKDAAGSAYMSMRKEWELLRIRYQLGIRVERASEPGYKDVLAKAEPYLNRNANETVLLNVAKMVDLSFANSRRINFSAPSFQRSFISLPPTSN